MDWLQIPSAWRSSTSRSSTIEAGAPRALVVAAKQG
jgi:hypothetical protein